MKTFRRSAGSAAIALGLAAVLAIGVPATAVDFYVVDSDLGQEDASSDRGYPDETWFTGSSTTGTQTSTDDGLVVTGRTMLLYGMGELTLTRDVFFEVVQSIEVDADGPWSLQLPVYFDNNTPDLFTTFRPAANNSTPSELDSEWITSQALNFGVSRPAGSSMTLQEIGDTIDGALHEAGVNPALLAFGILVDSGETTVRSITFNGDTHFFTAEPEEEEEPPVVEPPVEEPPVVEPPVVEAPVVEDDDTAAPATPVEDEATFTG